MSFFAFILNLLRSESKAATVAKTGGVAAAVGALGLAAALIIPFEGYEPKVAPDPIGVPTWCYGETEGPIPYGKTFTVAECKAMLIAKLPRYDKEMMRCVHVDLPDAPHAAFLSFTYNVGSGAFCKSTLVRKLNAGDLRGACDELPRWNQAGGRVWPGLVRRRAEERELCLKGVQ